MRFLQCVAERVLLAERMQDHGENAPSIERLRRGAQGALACLLCLRQLAALQRLQGFAQQRLRRKIVRHQARNQPVIARRSRSAHGATIDTAWPAGTENSDRVFQAGR